MNTIRLTMIWRLRKLTVNRNLKYDSLYALSIINMVFLEYWMKLIPKKKTLIFLFF